MDFILENLEDVVEIGLELIKALYKLIVKKFIPFVIGFAENIKREGELARFKEELDIKKTKLKEDLKEFNEKN